ncbi:unnamed protein product [Trichobilharzia regenti]|nr:unnamed protein product [Trichobilharzia regenti]
MENMYDCVSYPGYSGSSSSESSLFDALTSPPSPLNESNNQSSSIDLLSHHHNNCYHNNQKQQLYTQEEIPLAMKIIGMSNVSSSDQEIIDSSVIPLKNELDDYSLDPPLNHSAAASSSAVISTAPVSLHKPSVYLNDIYSNKSNSTSSRRAISPATNTTVNDNMNCMTSHPMGLSSVKNQVSLYEVGIQFKEIRQFSTSFLLCLVLFSTIQLYLLDVYAVKIQCDLDYIHDHVVGNDSGTLKYFIFYMLENTRFSLNS